MRSATGSRTSSGSTAADPGSREKPQGYIDLAGETFREEEALLEARLFGQKSGQK
ncbi:MAG: hypothetical protein ACJ76U_17490 [Gaiellaceae bacterium]